MAEAPETRSVEPGEEAELSVPAADGGESTIAMSRVPFIVGRTGADHEVQDPAISRKHCALDIEEGAWVVRDLKSSNGTYVNGERRERQVLAHGDCIRIGKTEMVFRFKRVSGRSPAGGAPSKMELAENTALWNIVELSVGTGEERDWMHGYLESVLKRFRADRGGILAYDRATRVSMPVVTMDASSAPEGAGAAVSLSIVNTAIMEQRVIVTTNAEIDPRFMDASSVAKYDISAVMCAPTRWRGEVVGAVYVERGLGREPFTDEQGQEIQDLADLLGTAQMAWRGHLMSSREAWERETLGAIFDETEVSDLIGRGGASAVERHTAEVTSVTVHLARLEDLLNRGREETWKLVSQFYAECNEILQQYGGGLTGGGAALFRNREGKEDFPARAVRAGMEIQRRARSLVKHVVKEEKAGMSVGVGIATGRGMIGFFGAGRRKDYLALGEVRPASEGLAFQAEDGEVLIDHGTYNRVRTLFNTHRLAPQDLPGVAVTVQMFRILAY